MTKKVSKKGKGTYATYKTEDRCHKNKILKLTKHIAKFPNDTKAQSELTRLSKTHYTGRSTPSRDKSLMVALPGSTSLVSLKLINGRLSAKGKLFQRLESIAKAGINEAKYKSKAERANIEKAKAKLIGDKEANVKAKREVSKKTNKAKPKNAIK